MERIEAEGGAVKGFIGAIRPPRLEKAFSRAAASLKCRIAASFSGSAEDCVDGEGCGCVKDPGPSKGQIRDNWCGNGGKEAEIEGATDDVVVFGAGGGEMDRGRVLVLGGEGFGESDFGGKGGCTGDGGPIPGVKNGDANGGDLDDDDEQKDGPILIEGLI